MSADTSSQQRVYPDGWTLVYGPCGSARTGTLRVGFATASRDEVAEIAAQAQSETAAQMEVFMDDDGDWCYRPAIPSP